MVNCTLTYQQKVAHLGANLQFILTIIFVSNTLSLLCITFLIFVHWKKGPDWWTKISHGVFKTLVIANFAIIPGLNLIFITIAYASPKFPLRKDPISSWLVFFSIVCFYRCLEYFTVIRKSIVCDAKTFLEQKEAAKIKSHKEMQEELF